MSILRFILFLVHLGAVPYCTSTNAASQQSECIQEKTDRKSKMLTNPRSESEACLWSEKPSDGRNERSDSLTNTRAVVQLLVVFDSTLHKRFIKDSRRFWNIVRWLVHEMDTVFVESTLSNPSLRIQLADFIVTEDIMIDKDFRMVDRANRLRLSKRNVNFVDGHAVLESYTSTINTNRTRFSKKFDHCIIFTSLDILKLDGDGVESDILGCTYQSSTCTHERFSLVEYYGDMRMLLRTSLHELGHGIGGFHDGGFNTHNIDSIANHCLPRHGFIMGLPIRSSTNFLKFSNCSLADFSSYLRSTKASCLFVG
ncbi:metalloprotease mig-17-like [Anneissia japonica]|uniref:metalloprotease mig-17-like n=1 Tax=Anneissia japonica TaxID=1529436 RepID=UPI0014257084|nr:metalloprotease mig-17-like [Anneissia japonica]